MFGTIYYHVALASFDTFRIMYTSIPELYRWVKNKGGREIVENYFTYNQIFIEKNFLIYDHIKLHVKTFLGNKLHSINDQPAHIMVPVYEQISDSTPRDKLLSIVQEHKYGISMVWYKYGAQHRANDLPAVFRIKPHIATIYGKRIHPYYKGWFKNGRSHRDNDKPAIINLMGDLSPNLYYLSWFKDNSLWRENGPVIVTSVGKYTYTGNKVTYGRAKDTKKIFLKYIEDIKI